MTIIYPQLKPILQELERSGNIEEHGLKIKRMCHDGSHHATIYTNDKIINLSAKRAKHLERAIVYEFFLTRPIFQRMLEEAHEFEDVRSESQHSKTTDFFWA